MPPVVIMTCLLLVMSSYLRTLWTYGRMDTPQQHKARRRVRRNTLIHGRGREVTGGPPSWAPKLRLPAPHSTAASLEPRISLPPSIRAPKLRLPATHSTATLPDPRTTLPPSRAPKLHLPAPHHSMASLDPRTTLHRLPDYSHGSDDHVVSPSVSPCIEGQADASISDDGVKAAAGYLLVTLQGDGDLIQGDLIQQVAAEQPWEGINLDDEGELVATAPPSGHMVIDLESLVQLALLKQAAGRKRQKQAAAGSPAGRVDRAPAVTVVVDSLVEELDEGFVLV